MNLNLHLSHFLSDTVHLDHCMILCFTETHLNGKPECDVKDFDNRWQTVLQNSCHRMVAISFNTEYIELIEEFPVTDAVEIMACHLRCHLDTTECDIIPIVVYRKQEVSPQHFLYILQDESQKLPSDFRIIITGDFNMDQRLEENVEMLNLFVNQRIGFHNKVNFSTHVQGGILDLFLDSHITQSSVPWQPTPFSDHFNLYYNL